MNFQFSGVEMEDMARDFPELIEEMRKWVKEKRLGFIGGTYSQPHLHVFGPESNIRQFEYGLEVFRRIFGTEIITYARQETGLHQQLPQILNAFGYKFSVVPAFYWTLRFIKGSSFPEIIGNRKFQSFVQGEEFTYWQGLDKSKIPLYLKSSSYTEEDEQRDLFHSPVLSIDFPDMREVEEDWYEEKRSKGGFYLLHEALEEVVREYPPTSQANLYTYWSYIEGMWAEALSRKNKEAEIRAVQAEAMEAMMLLSGEEIEGTREKIDKIWKNILTSQHHDVYWIETTDLKRKALSWLDEATKISEEIIKQTQSKIIKKIDTGKEEEEEEVVVVFNTLPSERKGIIKVKTEENEIVNDENKEFPAQRIEGKTNFIDTLPALGYKVYKLRKGRSIIKKRNLESEFENQYYKVKIREDGLFESMIEKSSGQELLDTKTYLGGEIKGRVRGKEASTRDVSRITKIEEGEIGKLIEIEGSLETIKYKERIALYYELPTIDVSLEFTFEGNEAGDFHIDESKLNIYWPVQRGDIFYDIPFGVEKGKEKRPLFAINWLDISTDKCGLTYINKGTPKHWVNNGVIANVIAWGGNKFSNRQGGGRWLKQTQYDLKLYGSHTISYSLYPHKNIWREARVANIAQDLSFPPLACQARNHKGILEKKRSFFELSPNSLMVTSIKNSEGKVSCRVYNIAEKTIPEVKGAKLIKIYDLSGKQIDEIGKFQIANLLTK
jgi:alpha-mannosidase